MQPNPTSTFLNLDRLGDYALDAADLLPLLQALANDLSVELNALTECLQVHPHEAPVLHRHLHALKGMAGMFAMPDLLAKVTQADDACRTGDLEMGVPLTQGLMLSLHDWLIEVRAWLQRYS